MPESKVLLDENLAKVFGWYMGDGYLNILDNFKCFGMCYSLDELEIREELNRILGSYGLSVKEHHFSEDKKMKADRIYNASWGRMINQYFGHTSHAKRIPKEILCSPLSVQVAFIAYWFAADGTVGKDKKLIRVKLESVNFDVLQDLKCMLANIGIMSSLRTHNTTCNGKKFKSNTLEIRQAWIKDFKEIIGIPGFKGKLTGIS